MNATAEHAMGMRRSGSAKDASSRAQRASPLLPPCHNHGSARTLHPSPIWAFYSAFTPDHGAVEATFTALIARNIGISFRAVFSAAARGPLVLCLWLDHSSIASTSKFAARSAFT